MWLRSQKRWYLRGFGEMHAGKSRSLGPSERGVTNAVHARSLHLVLAWQRCEAVPPGGGRRHAIWLTLDLFRKRSMNQMFQNYLNQRSCFCTFIGLFAGNSDEPWTVSDYDFACERDESRRAKKTTTDKQPILSERTLWYNYQYLQPNRDTTSLTSFQYVSDASSDSTRCPCYWARVI